MAKIYTRDSIQSLRAHGSKSEVPIFIVGMVRTGTTLLDQILSSHPDVRSAGEQPFWRVSAGRVNHKWLESGCDASDLKELETRYLDILGDASRNAPRVTDKMPTNFFHLGLMSVAFPRSKIVHIRRNPMDTAISIYTTFLGAGTQFAYDQGNIVAYFDAYMRMMDLWRSVLPEVQMIEIDYEALVSNKENVLPALLKFLELDWDESVLRHEEQASHVSTPSLWAARQPVNSASVERWRRYEPWLGELLELSDVRHPPATIKLDG